MAIIKISAIECDVCGGEFSGDDLISGLNERQIAKTLRTLADAWGWKILKRKDQWGRKDFCPNCRED